MSQGSRLNRVRKSSLPHTLTLPVKQQVERKKEKKKSQTLQTCALVHSCEYINISCPTDFVRLAVHRVYWQDWSLGVKPPWAKGSVQVLPTKCLSTWLERLVGHQKKSVNNHPVLYNEPTSLILSLEQAAL